MKAHAYVARGILNGRTTVVDAVLQREVELAREDERAERRARRARL